ncbi:hypothetical protein [Micromonospora halophytica]|uniref:hypothetical protein n=1 Tax=Micromonospora halophytica TaxID=47864 RepID=UPI000AB84378|nr:hypothetical protein [Micromonospora halophytica]
MRANSSTLLGSVEVTVAIAAATAGWEADGGLANEAVLRCRTGPERGVQKPGQGC